MITECIRRHVRGRLGYRSLIYQTASRVHTALITILREGFRTYQQIRRLRVGKGDAEKVYFRSLEHPLFLRPGTDDIDAVLNNIVRREYGQFDIDVIPKVIVDAGAYIGDTAAYFLSRFPTAKVYAVEPNPDSIAMAQRNLAPYGDRVSLIPAALYDKTTRVFVNGIATGAHIGNVGFDVETITLPALLKEIPEGFIDILKLDIEGAEAQLFGAYFDDWLPKVGMIIMETHGPEIEQRVLRTLLENGWTCELYRNLWYCRPNSA